MSQLSGPHLFSSLRFRLISLVLLALLPALALVLFTANQQRQLAASAAKAEALQLARAVDRSEQDLVQSTRQLLSLLAQQQVVREADPTGCPIFLSQVLRRYGKYVDLGVVAGESDPICQAGPRSMRLPGGTPATYYSRVMETKVFSAGDFLINRTTGKAVLPFGYPLFDEGGQIRSVVFASLDLGALDLMGSMSLLPPGSTLMIHDSTGRILARYPGPAKWVGESAIQVPVVKIVLGRQQEGTVEAVGEDEVTRLYAFTPLSSVPSGNIYAIVGIPTSVAYDEANQMLARNVLALGLVSALALGAAWFGSDWVVLRRLKTLMRVTTRLADGDLSARTGLDRGGGEMGILSDAFDRMAQSLQQRDTDRKQAEEQLRLWSAGLEDLINAMADAITASLDVPRIANIALLKTLEVMQLKIGGVFLKQGDDFVLSANRSVPAAAVPRLQKMLSSFETKDGAESEVQVVQDVEAPNDGGTSATAFKWICIPVKSRGRVFGIMTLACEPDWSFESNARNVLAAVGQQTGVAIENVELHSQVQSLATLRERERLSHELHDGLAQVLGYLSMRGLVAQNMVAEGHKDRAMTELQEMENAVQQAHQDLRESILGLRVTVSPQTGLISALKEYVHSFSLQTGIQVQLVPAAAGTVDYSPEVEVQLLRIIQEALGNIRKHSGAKQASIVFQVAPECSAVIIEDRGKGFDMASIPEKGYTHFGLQTMRERAESVGGSINVQSEPGKGTRVTITLPTRQGGL